MFGLGESKEKDLVKKYVEFKGDSKPANNRDRDHIAGAAEFMSKNLVHKEREPFHLPVEIPVKVTGELAGVKFSGEGGVRIIGFESDEAAREAGIEDWRFPGKDIPDYITYIDNKVGKMFSFRIGNDVWGWWRAKMPGRLTSTIGVNVVFLPTKDEMKKGGWVFFDAGKYNILLEFALNKRMGWTIWDQDTLWNLLTADSLSLGWPRELLMKYNVREHFFSNMYNKLLLAQAVRGRMGQDPSKPLRQVPAMMFTEALWVSRYVVYSSAIERFVFEHPELANLFPGWTADSMATHAINLRYQFKPQEDHQQHKNNQVEIMDIAGNLVGVAESFWWDKPRYILSPEYAVDVLVDMRKVAIDSPGWLKYDGGVDYVSKRNEYLELLLAGKVEEAKQAWEDTYRTYYRYLQSKAKAVPARDGMDMPTPDNWFENFQVIWLDRVQITAGWDLLLAYVRECVKRGQWKPVNVSPLRISAPQGAAVTTATST